MTKYSGVVRFTLLRGFFNKMSKKEKKVEKKVEPIVNDPEEAAELKEGQNG